MMMGMIVTVTPLFMGHEHFTLDFSFSMQLDVWDLSYLIRDKISFSAVEALSLNHWTTREVPHIGLFCPRQLWTWLSTSVPSGAIL